MRHLLLVVGLVWPIGFASAQTFGEISGGEVRDQSGRGLQRGRRGHEPRHQCFSLDYDQRRRGLQLMIWQPTAR